MSIGEKAGVAVIVAFCAGILLLVVGFVGWLILVEVYEDEKGESAQALVMIMQVAALLGGVVAVVSLFVRRRKNRV
jgi:nitrate reductase gamma subunit